MAQNLFQDVIRVSLTTSAVIAVLLLFLPLIHKNYTAKWRHFVWLVLAVRLLIPFSPSFPQTPIEITPVSQNIEFNIPVQKRTESYQQISQNGVHQAAEFSAVSSSSVPLSSVPRTITLNKVLSVGWALGIALFMLYHLIGYFIFKKSALRFSKSVDDKHIIELWLEVKEEMKVSDKIELWVCKKVQSPMMTGFFRPLLLLPDLDYSDVDLKLILKHEIIHYRRRDIWYKLLMVCANAVHWFNPLVYLMAATSYKDIEMACDSELIKDSDSAFRKQYSETILWAIHKGNQRRTAFSTYFYGGRKTMKERFVNIFDMNKKRRGIITLCAVIIITGIAGSSVAYGVNDSKVGERIDNMDLVQIQSVANQWAEAVKSRDGKVQYDLMSSELQKKVYEDYLARNWVTGQSSPWIDGFEVNPHDKTAAITYTYMTSEGFAGYYLQTLTFALEKGQLMISDYTEPKQANGQSEGTVLAYLGDGRTWLSAAILHEGFFSDMTLSINGKTKRLPWKTYGEPAFLPELSYADVDGDGRKELIVILCKGEGTGVFVEEIHVLNPENFSEISVQSPLAALEKRVVSKIDEYGVEITIDNQNTLVFPEKEITAKVAEKKNWFDNLETGSIIVYSIQGNNVVVTVAAQLLPAGFLGEFNLTYEYKDNQLKISDISFSADL